MRAIQRELGDADPNAGEAKSLRERVAAAVLPAEVRKAAEQELDRLAQMSPAAAEYAVARNYLDWILTLPWEKSTADKLDLKAAQKVLNDEHFGLPKIKDRLLEFLAVLKRRKEIKGPILCLVGPPGVGKTSLGKKSCGRAGSQIRAHLARRHAGRGRDSRAIAALTSARCPGASSKLCAASRAGIR